MNYRNLFPFLLLAAASAMLPGCNHKKIVKSEKVELPPVRAEVLQVRAGAFTSTVAVTGTLVSRSSVDIKAETTGRVVRFEKQEGDRVEAGEAVIWVNDENHRLDLMHAESQVKVAEAGLEKARVLEAHTQSELERARNLLKSGGITERDLRAAEVAHQDARAGVLFAGAQLEQTKAALAFSKKRLADTVIRAPVSGDIRARMVNPGAYVEPPTPVFSIVDNRTLELECLVPTIALASLRAGQRVSFTVNSYPSESFDGRIIDINPAVDAASRSAKVRFRVENSARKLKDGMFAQGEILTGVKANAVVIPVSAVYRDDRSASNSYVFIVENGKAVRRNILIGGEKDREVEVLQGLEPGQALIAVQSIEIAEGVPVEPASAAPAPAAALKKAGR